MKVILITLNLLLFSIQSVAKSDYATLEYNKATEIINTRAYEVSNSDIEKIITYALMETHPVWESNIFGQIRHGLKSFDIKYSVSKHLVHNLADIFFHNNEIFSFKGQKFSITENTRFLALQTLWDLAHSKLESRDVFDLIEKRMFDVSMMALSDNIQEQKQAQRFLNQSLNFIKARRHDSHLDLLTLGIKNHIFNIYAAAENSEVKSTAYEIINTVIKNGKQSSAVSAEYGVILADLTKSFSFQSCRKLWN